MLLGIPSSEISVFEVSEFSPLSIRREQRTSLFFSFHRYFPDNSS